jgi:hypothetical protein
MVAQTNHGEVRVGDTIVFSHPAGEKHGKVVKISNELNGLLFSTYYHDKYGGMTLTIPVYNILKVISGEKMSKQEEIKKPTRYNKRGKLECWDVILDQEMDFLEGNILKYLWRYKEKNGVEDLKKAKVYLDKLISEVESKK